MWFSNKFLIVYNLMWKYGLYYTLYITICMFSRTDTYLLANRDILLFLYLSNHLIISVLSLIVMERVKILVMVVLVVWFVIMWGLDYRYYIWLSLCSAIVTELYLVYGSRAFIMWNWIWFWVGCDYFCIVNLTLDPMHIIFNPSN